jgi:hypothetical protein
MSGEDKKKKEIEPGYTNVLWNTLKPFTAGGKAIMGAAEYVGIEVIVGQTIRRIMKAPYNVAESIELHTYSVPFLGQTNFGDPYAPLNFDSNAKFEIVDEMTEGAKAIPAAIVGYTAMRVRRDGLKVPGFANRDFLYMLVGKVLSRPLTQFIFTSLPEDFQLGLTVLQELAARQKTVIDSAKRQAGGQKRQ